MLRHPSLKHRATMPLALSMALAWYTTSLPLSHNPILNPCAPSSLYAVLRSFVLSFHVPCAPSSFSMFLYVCSFYVRAPCVVPGAPCLYFGRYSCSFVGFMQARGRSLQIAVARSDGASNRVWPQLDFRWRIPLRIMHYRSVRQDLLR